MNHKTVCFTGHRQIPISQYALIKESLTGIITHLIMNGYCFFGTGGAIGFDTLAAHIILSLKKLYPHIRLILVLPCICQTQNWNRKNILEYENIKSQADKIVYTQQEYSIDCMYKRNRHLVNNSSVCICYLTKATGGTAYTVRYAREKGLSIINVADK